ncbi:MAG: hypothetical protein ACREOC_12745 [Gemmatimonadales bacterium]
MSGGSRRKRVALATIVLSTLLIAAGYASALAPGGAPPWTPWTLALGIPCLIVGLMGLGAARADRSPGPLVFPFAFVWIVLTGGFAAALLLQPTDPADPVLWLGLPPGAALVLYGIGLSPIVVLPVAYALTFEASTLSEQDLERVRAARPGPPPPVAPER